jgi:hypothetical protein
MHLPAEYGLRGFVEPSLPLSDDDAATYVLVSAWQIAVSLTILGIGQVCTAERLELRFPHPDWVPMQTRQSGLEGTGEIRLRDLVKEALRMRPSRIIVGEVRAEECLDLLLALNAGLPGMCTLHANSAREALVKTCTLPLLAGENISWLSAFGAAGRSDGAPFDELAMRTRGFIAVNIRNNTATGVLRATKRVSIRKGRRMHANDAGVVST